MESECRADLEASVLEEKVLETVATGAVQMALDSSGAIEEVEVRAERPFWKKAKKWLEGTKGG